MKLPAAFGIVLRELRKEKGLSQERLAELANLDRTYVSLLERGLRQPSLTVLFELSVSLEIKPSGLIELVEKKERQNAPLN